ncbi:MAG TPA: thiamine-phosphate kinase [Rhizomicrobium sp.]|nr:thiamine-phosphate kinase [Rhizomicrobium sp.]
MDEFEIIAEIFAPLAVAPGAFGLKDDAAAIAARPGFDLIVTIDQIAEGTDFFAFDPAGAIAQKALRVNLSDLAAKGAEPAYYLLSLSLPVSVTLDWLTAFAAGLAEDQKTYGISLLGGDTSRAEGPLAITITAFGFVPEGRMVKRSGARAGDAVYVTGTIGDSGGGLAIFKREKHALTETQRDHLTGRYQLPEPPVVFGAALRELASASVDVSDGLIADLGHIAAGSGVGIQLFGEKIPRTDALRALWGEGMDAIGRAVTAGDDYQIAFTANPAMDSKIQFASRNTGVSVTCIGTVTTGQDVELLLHGESYNVSKPGYRHF